MRRRGMLSLDLLIALILLTFLVIWLQDYFMLLGDNVGDSGVSMQLKTGAIYVGSQMNMFYAGAKSGEKMNVTPFNISGFPGAVTISKSGSLVTVGYMGRSATYPVAGDMTYDASKRVVSR